MLPNLNLIVFTLGIERPFMLNLEVDSFERGLFCQNISTNKRERCGVHDDTIEEPVIGLDTRPYDITPRGEHKDFGTLSKSYPTGLLLPQSKWGVQLCEKEPRVRKTGNICPDTAQIHLVCANRLKRTARVGLLLLLLVLLSFFRRKMTALGSCQ